MDDGAGALSKERLSATDAVQSWIASMLGGARQLSRDQIERLYSKRDIVHGWRIGIELGARYVEIDLLLDGEFPWRPAILAVADRSLHLKLPHVEVDGVLCVFPSSVEVDPYSPVASVRRTLYLGARLLDEGFSGQNREDFRHEFASYWPTDPGALTVHSLISPEGPSRYVEMWRGQNFCVVGDSAETVLPWMENRFGKSKGERRSASKAVYLHMGAALYPHQFPRTASALLAIATEHTSGGSELLLDLVSKRPDAAVVVLGAPTMNGPALAAMTLVPPPSAFRGPGRQRVDTVSAGFRPSKVPAAHTSERMFGGQSVLRSRVTRVDAPWVHGRGTDRRQAVLNSKSVVMIGCGSVGSAVVELIAKAGVGRLVLIDPDILSWANIGRHTLGAVSVGKNKVEALASGLRANFPHIREIASVPTKWQDALVHSPALLQGNDLIVSTVGSWAAEGALNSWHIRSGLVSPILYGWTEPHAAAGQAVLVRRGSGCLACGMSTVGVPNLRVTQWPNGATQRQEPACGAVYQPYGPVELTYVTATIANLALQALIGDSQLDEHVLWCAPPTVAQAEGGDWTSDWRAIAGERRGGGFIEKRGWPKSPTCVVCGGSGW